MLEMKITPKASQEEMEAFYKDMDELYDEPSLNPLPSGFYKLVER